MSSLTNSPTVFSSSGLLAGISWLNASNVASSDNSYATSALTLGTINSQYLMLSGFGFNIPLNANITGIQLSIERNALLGTPADVQDDIIKLMKAGSIVGNNKAAATLWTTSDVIVTYGTDGDGWGTNWNPAHINDPNFGCVIATQLAQGLAGNTTQIDNVIMTVFFNLLLLENSGPLGCSFMLAH